MPVDRLSADTASVTISSPAVISDLYRGARARSVARRDGRKCRVFAPLTCLCFPRTVADAAMIPDGKEDDVYRICDGLLVPHTARISRD